MFLFRKGDCPYHRRLKQQQILLKNVNLPDFIIKSSLTRFPWTQELISEFERGHFVDARFLQDFEKTFAESLIRLPLHPLTQYFGRSELRIEQCTVFFQSGQECHSSLSNVFQEICGESTHWLLRGEFLRNLQKEGLAVEKTATVRRIRLVCRVGKHRKQGRKTTLKSGRHCVLKFSFWEWKVRLRSAWRSPKSVLPYSENDGPLPGIWPCNITLTSKGNGKRLRMQAAHSVICLISQESASYACNCQFEVR